MVFDCNKILYFLKRGTSDDHREYNDTFIIGNFTLVTNKPELRFHDGETVGGIPIPITVELHEKIISVYGELGCKIRNS